MHKPEDIGRLLDRVLPFVQKPARYTGGEYNSVTKDWTSIPFRLALVFPDIYDLGMSNFGLAVLYDSVNRQPDMLAERAFTPWVDMQRQMRRHGLPLYALESRRPLRDFDVLGFSLPYEQLYTNVLTTLDLAGIPLRSVERTETHPLVLAGGSACLNPEPMHAFFDAFFIGEADEAIVEILRTWGESRSAGLSRAEALARLARIEGIYVPSLFDVTYAGDGSIQRVMPKREANATAHPARPAIRRRIVPVLPPPPTRLVVPYVETVHNRATIEIQRGCTRGCRFCQAGMIYRPVRERPIEQILEAVDAVLQQTGFHEISFLSLSASDYSHISDLVSEVVRRHAHDNISVGLPSLRIESFSLDLIAALEKGRRRSGFTFAPEAATDRLRDVINKPITTEALLEVAGEVYRRGWTTIKLYFMIGHPTQTAEDVQAIASLAHQVRRIGFHTLGKKACVRIGVSTLVPKPHTPFQWLPMAGEAEILAQIAILERELRGPGIELSWNEPSETLLEATLSRGDRRLAEVIELAWRHGARFDAWGDQFNEDAWKTAFTQMGVAPDWYARRTRSFDEVLPWDHIDVGVSKAFLAREYGHALQGAVVDDCRKHCYSCGILGRYKELRRATNDEAWGCPPIGHSRPGQPVSPQPTPLYFNPQMHPRQADVAQGGTDQRAGE